MKETKHPVLYVLADGVEYRDTSTDVNKLRGSEKDVVTVINEQNKDYIVIFDNRYESRLLAGLGIGQTLVVMLILAAGSLALTRITIDLVIHPIEAMMEKVNRIGENPLKAAAEEENE